MSLHRPAICEQLQIAYCKLQIHWLIALTLLIALSGCTHRVYFYRPPEQRVINRDAVEFPAHTQLLLFAEGLTGPSSFCFDAAGNMILAENSQRDDEPHIYGVRPDLSRFDIYPFGRRVPFITTGFEIYGPIGGMVATEGKIFITHRDAKGKGCVTAFGYDGSHTTIVADLPAQGDFSVTDIAVRPTDGRLFFGMGAATNGGVVGTDNSAVGWVRKHPNACDQSFVTLKLNGYKFTTKNPDAGLFSGPDTVATGPFQPFGLSDKNRIQPAITGKPNAAIYSVSPAGGDLQVEAHGLRLPRGLAFNEFGGLYATNDGMEMRGSRPVKDDPDSLLWIILSPGHRPDSIPWYGWPDYTADLLSITDQRFQPPEVLPRRSGYPDVSPLIDLSQSNPPNRLLAPDTNRGLLVTGTFPSLSGAAKMTIMPASGPFRQFQGSAIVALSGDRAPFATSGYPLARPVGYKLARVDLDKKQVSDFIVNTQRVPASKLGKGALALERPIDVKIGPDGAIYILDYGKMIMKNGQEHVIAGTGKIFKLMRIEEKPAPTTATRPAE
jgi:glucose/arabinose dehydrogenase